MEKMADIFTPIPKIVEEANESFKKLSEILKTDPEIVTPQTALDKTENETSTQLPKQKTQKGTHPGMIDKKSLENTISNMKKKINLFNIDNQ